MAHVQFRGKGRLTNWMGEMASRFVPEADCHPVPGARVSVSLNDRVGRLMWTGCYEPELVALLRQVLDPGATFVDVGAHIGYFSIVAAALVGESGAVQSFEPDPDCFSRLVVNSCAYPGSSRIIPPWRIGMAESPFIEVQIRVNLGGERSSTRMAIGQSFPFGSARWTIGCRRKESKRSAFSKWM